jgi:hypothetical protein
MHYSRHDMPLSDLHKIQSCVYGGGTKVPTPAMHVALMTLLTLDARQLEMPEQTRPELAYLDHRSKSVPGYGGKCIGKDQPSWTYTTS